MQNKLKTLLKHEHYGEILKSSSIVLIIRIVAAVVTLLLTVLITNQLGAKESGSYFFILSFLTFLSSFASFGLFNALLKEIAIHSKQLISKSAIMTKSVVLVFCGTIITGILFFIFNQISIYLGYEHAIINTYYFNIIFILFPFILTFLFSNYYQATKNIVISMFMLNFGYQLLMLIILYIHKIKTTEELLLIFDISVVSVVLMGLIIYIVKGGRFTLQGDKTFKALLALSTPMMVAHIVSQINSFSGIMLLSIFADEVAISYYAVSLRIALLMSFLIIAVNKIVAPKFAILYHERKIAELKKVVIFSNRLLAIVSFPMLVIIIIFGKQILNLFGDGFEDGYSALIFIAIGQFFASVSGTVIFLLQMTGSEKVIRTNIIIATFSSIFLGLVLVPLYGLLGAAIATSFGLILVNLLACIQAYKILGINPLQLFEVQK